jgi:hypothetical protein
MITGGNVLAMLIPTGGRYIAGNEYENIQFLECDPITKEEFEAGFAKYEAWKAEQDAKKAADKAALLERLGITEAEAHLLLA